MVDYREPTGAKLAAIDPAKTRTVSQSDGSECVANVLEFDPEATENDPDNVHSKTSEATPATSVQVFGYGSAHSPLFGFVDGVGWVNGMGGASRADLDDDEHIAVPGQDIEFCSAYSQISVLDAVAQALQVCNCQGLTSSTERKTVVAHGTSLRPSPIGAKHALFSAGGTICCGISCIFFEMVGASVLIGHERDCSSGDACVVRLYQTVANGLHIGEPGEGELDVRYCSRSQRRADILG